MSYQGRLIQIYFFRFFLKYFITALAVFIFIMFMASFLSIINEGGVMNGFSQYFFFKSMLWLVPSIFSYSLPFAFVMGFMLSFSEFENSGELKAAYAGGFSPKEIFPSVFSFSIILSIALVLANSWLVPLGNRRSREYVRTMFSNITNVNFTSQTFENVSNFSIYAQDVSISGALRKVKLFKREEKKTGIFSISASSGTMNFSEGGITIRLANGLIKFFSYGNNSRFYEGEFSSYDAFLPFYSSNNVPRSIPVKELTSVEILSLPDTDFSYKFQGLRQIFFRLFSGLSPVAFFFAAFSLSIIFSGKGKFIAFAMSLVSVFSYYGLAVFADFVSSKSPKFFPWITSLPFVVLLLFGFPIWKKSGDKL